MLVARHGCSAVLRTVQGVHGAFMENSVSAVEWARADSQDAEYRVHSYILST